MLCHHQSSLIKFNILAPSKTLRPSQSYLSIILSKSIRILDMKAFTIAAALLAAFAQAASSEINAGVETDLVTFYGADDKALYTRTFNVDGSTKLINMTFWAFPRLARPHHLDDRSTLIPYF